ncbi:hypothetical protein [Propionivibrio sp.]|uniref:hypothetical protein n=1 Tax=Propionivibrio sp. TaxID=2212460 RepID=UPI0039E49931
MKTPKSRIKLSLILAIPIFTLVVWITWLHAMSSSVLLAAVSIWQLVAWGGLTSLVVAYAMTLYISALRQEDEQGRK